MRYGAVAWHTQCRARVDEEGPFRSWTKTPENAMVRLVKECHKCPHVQAAGFSWIDDNRKSIPKSLSVNRSRVNVDVGILTFQVPLRCYLPWTIHQEALLIRGLAICFELVLLLQTSKVVLCFIRRRTVLRKSKIENFNLWPDSRFRPLAIHVACTNVSYPQRWSRV